MKQILMTSMTILLSTLIACNNTDNKSSHDSHETAAAQHDTNTITHTVESKEVKLVPVTFAQVDAKAAASIKQIVDHYLHIKNALAGDNASEAAVGGKAMRTAIGKLDKSLLTAEQKKVYDESQSKLSTHAASISENAASIELQRQQFADMSEGVYSLVKAFGGGRPLYHDHCPMARDNKGAMWVSELKEVKNPYFGATMSTCGSVEEVIQ